MKKKKRDTKGAKKFLGSLAIGALVVSGGAFAANTPMHHQTIKKSKDFLKKMQSVNSTNLSNIQGIRDFRESTLSISPEPLSNSVNEEAVIKAENEGNYLKWVKALDNIEGYFDSEPLNASEFDLLVKLRQKRSEFEEKL